MPGATVGEASNYLLPEAEVIVATHEGVPLYVELPTSVVLEITYTEPGLQGDRSTGGTKPATVETGATVRCRCSSPPARRSRWTPATAATSVAPEPDGRQRPSLQPLARRKSRRRALDVLYSADLRDDRRPTRCWPTRWPGWAADVPDHMAYAVELVEGVAGQRRPHRRADLLATPRAGRWTGCRWSTATWPGSPSTSCSTATTSTTPVAISEAVELAGELSTDDSPRFLNGLLGRIAEYATR